MKINLLFIGLLLTCSFIRGQGQGEATSNAVKHLGAGVAIGAVGGYAAHKIFNGNRAWTWAGAVGSSLAAGLAKETYDKSRGAVWENDDIVYTAIGGAISGLVMDMLLNKRRSSGKKCGCPPLAIQVNKIETNFVTNFETGSGDIAAAIQANHLIHIGL